MAEPIQHKDGHNIDIQKLTDFLVSTELFKGLDPTLWPKITLALTPLAVERHAALVRQGEAGDALYLVVRGCLRVVLNHGRMDEQLLNQIGPGESFGETAFLDGLKRSATVVADEPSDVVMLSRASLEQLTNAHPEAVAAVVQAIKEEIRRRQLRAALRSTPIFGALAPDVLRDLEAELDWVSLRGGETLIRQGEPGDCLYVVISGRLRIVLEEEGQEVRTLREVSRGESIGEMALITGARRAATVYAIRDSQVARLSQSGFDAFQTKHPRAVTRTFTRSIVESLNRQLTGERPGVNALKSIAVIPANRAIDLAGFTCRLVSALANIGPTLHLSSNRVDDALGKPNLAQALGGDDQANDAQLAAWLSEQETHYQHIVYETDPAPTTWSRRCVRQADHTLIVGHATACPMPGELEAALLSDAVGRARKPNTLVLLHRDGQSRPQGTQRWLTVRQVEQHLHVRWHNAADFARLARFVAGRSIGLALSGGGARGLAHIGVLRALTEAGIPVDMIGGTSMGSMIGAQCAMGWCAQAMLDACRGAKLADPLDYTLPVVSLMSGQAMADKLQEFFGDIQIEDLWLPFFCVSANLTRAEKMVHHTGSVRQAVRASGCVPGVFPPVIHNGDALVDGGLLDNLPVANMRDLCGAGTVIAVDVFPSVDLAKIKPYGDALSGWRALNSSFNPLAPKLNMPNFMTLLYRTMEVCSVYDQRARHQSLADLWLSPPVAAFSINDFHAIDEIVELGFRHAQEQIARWQEAGLGKRFTPITNVRHKPNPSLRTKETRRETKGF